MTTSIDRISAWPISFALPPEYQVNLGIGKAIKRDAVLVEVRAGDGISGWGEAHAGRAPTVIAELVSSTLAPALVGMDSESPEEVWERIYRLQLASHGTGAAAAIALSGIDMALWDIRGQRQQRPLFQLLSEHTIDDDRSSEAASRCMAYAGGIALGFDTPARLSNEASDLVGRGFRALKLRVGDSVSQDVARIAAVRNVVGNDVTIMVDANTAYTVNDVAAIGPALTDHDIRWLEEPFPAHDFKSYRQAQAVCPVPIAAGENHYTRFDFERCLDDGVITVWQPDISKTGGITELMRIARLANTAGIEIHPHTSVTALNMSASLHVLAAIPNAGYFEADVSRFNPFRDELFEAGIEVDVHGYYAPPSGPGLGVTVDESVMASFGAISGAGYV